MLEKNKKIGFMYQVSTSRNERRTEFFKMASPPTHAPTHRISDSVVWFICFLSLPLARCLQCLMSNAQSATENSSFSVGCRKRRAGSTALPGMRTTTEIRSWRSARRRRRNRAAREPCSRTSSEWAFRPRLRCLVHVLKW